MKWWTSGPKGSGDGEAHLTMAATKNTSTTRQSLARSVEGRKDSGRSHSQRLFSVGKEFRRGRRETMRRAVANDGLRDREGERRGLREGMPTDRKADIKLPRRRGGRRGGREKRLSSSHNKWSRSMAAGSRRPVTSNVPEGLSAAR